MYIDFNRLIIVSLKLIIIFIYLESVFLELKDCSHSALTQGHPIVRFVAGQLAYILEERVTDSRCFISDVKTVE